MRSLPRSSTSEEVRRFPVPTQRLVRPDRPASRAGVAGTAIGHGERRLQPDVERASGPVASPARSTTPSSMRSHPPCRHRRRHVGPPGRVQRGSGLRRHRKQRRRHQRGDEHHEQAARRRDRRPSTPSCSPMVAKISPTSPRGIMPRPMSGLSPGEPIAPTAASELADDRDNDERGGDLEHRRPRRIDATSTSMPICEEEDRDEEVADRGEIARDPLALVAAAEREPGDERADDRGELRGVGELARTRA